MKKDTEKKEPGEKLKGDGCEKMVDENEENTYVSQGGEEYWMGGFEEH